jgi:hypothetical protein
LRPPVADCGGRPGTGSSNGIRAVFLEPVRGLCPITNAGAGVAPMPVPVGA